MALLTSGAAASAGGGRAGGAKKLTFMEGQKLAKQRAYEKQAKKKKIGLARIFHEG